MTRRSLSFAIVCVSLTAASCASGPNDPGGSSLGRTFAAQMASTWHFAGAPQRVQVGILVSDDDGTHVVTQGTIEVAFSFLGDGGAAPEQGPTATATYLPVPGTDGSGDAPTVAAGANGVYEAEDVTFDQPGIWRATLSLEIDGVVRELATSFEVLQESPIPAPGMPAPATETLTIDSDVREGAIDSVADAGGEIPDPELHRISIADAVAQGRPALVLFGTPRYCTSRFCGPEVTELQHIAAEHPDRAVYIHVEIWKEYAPPEIQVVNKGAVEWLLWKRPDGTPEMTEPWLFLIGADGIVAERWGPLFDTSEVTAALEALPPMDG
jgi:hypothetical protein